MPSPSDDAALPPTLVQPRPVYAAAIHDGHHHHEHQRSGWTSGTVSPPPTTSLPQRGGSPGFRVPSRTSMRSPQIRSQHSSPAPAELELFEQNCRVFFYGASTSDGSGWGGGRKAVEEAGRAIERTLSTVPVAHRAGYISLQNKLRQQFHADSAKRRRLALEGVLCACTPNSALSSVSRDHLESLNARHERSVRFSDFVSTHCTQSSVGLHPFFAALAALFAIQARSTRSGGGGAHCLVWELDDAVLMEAGDDVFQRDAISMLSGVLGFTNAQLSRTESGTSDANPFIAHEVLDAQPHARIWTLSPHMSDPELAWLARRVPRFAHSSLSASLPLFRPSAERTGPGGTDGALEACAAQGRASLHSDVPGDDDVVQEAGDVVKLPTGKATRGMQPRSEGYRGSALERIVEWIRRLLWGYYAGST